MKEKYALLDTDFISKTHLVRKDDQDRLIDRITKMPGYRFFCHEQIRTELKRHNIAGSPNWLDAKISSGVVSCISDSEIIDELRDIYADSAAAVYANMLKMDVKHTGALILKIISRDCRILIMQRLPRMNFWRSFRRTAMKSEQEIILENSKAMFCFRCLL